MSMPTYGALKQKIGPEHGTTTVSLPAHLCKVRVNNQGKITGSGSKITVSHSDPGTFCKKVKSVQIVLNGTCNGQGCSHYLSPSKRMLDLCNFSANNVWFNFVFPGVNVPSQQTDIANAWAAECRGTGRNGAQILTKHPWFNKNVQLHMIYNNNDYYREFHDVPPVMLTCDPCPRMTVKNSIQLKADAMVTLPMSSVVTSGGIAPYTVTFTRLPTGLIRQGTNLTGRPALGTYTGTVTVRDSCCSATNLVTKNFRFDVKDSVAPEIVSFNVTPMAFNYTGGNITASVKALDDVGVEQVRVILIKPNGQRSGTPPIARVSGTTKNGEWKHSWKMNPNTTATPQVYGIQVRVSDTGGNLTTSQTISVTVPVKQARPAKPMMPTGLPK